MARLGGFLAGSESARTSSLEPVRLRVWHRLPWLLLGLAGAILAATIVGGFEEQLSENLLLAFFIPGVIYMADAVGTQTETLVIRGLSVGVGIRGIVRRELVTGLIVGVILAAAFTVVGLLAWDDADVILAVALALLCRLRGRDGRRHGAADPARQARGSTRPSAAGRSRRWSRTCCRS